MESKATKQKHRTRSTKALKPTFNRVAVITENKSQKRFDYGKGNTLPNTLLKGIEASITATACRGKKQEFIEGNGIKDQDVALMVVNPDQTGDDLITELSDVVGVFDGLVLVVKFNAEGVRKYVYNLPFELVRKTTGDQYYYNEGLAKGKDVKKERVYYKEYDPTETPQSRLKRIGEQIEEYGFQTGDIIYSYNKKAGQKEYPVPTAWSGMEEIEADAALGFMDWRNVKKGFRPDAILTTVGTLDNETEDEFGKTEQDYFDKDLEAFTGEDAAPIMHINVDSVEEAPKLETFNQEKVLNSTTEAADRIGRRVCRAMEVPEVLVPGFAKTGQLGNVQEMENTLKMFQRTIGRKQRMITRALSRVYPTLDWTIEQLELIKPETTETTEPT